MNYFYAENRPNTGVNCSDIKCVARNTAESFSLFLKGISSLDPEKLRLDLEHQLAEWTSLERGTTEEQRITQDSWRKYELLTSSLSQELCEQLRLVLEPSLATKLKYVSYILNIFIGDRVPGILFGVRVCWY